MQGNLLKVVHFIAVPNKNSFHVNKKLGVICFLTFKRGWGVEVFSFYLQGGGEFSFMLPTKFQIFRTPMTAA